VAPEYELSIPKIRNHRTRKGATVTSLGIGYFTEKYKIKVLYYILPLKCNERTVAKPCEM
jgi:hypothetical protein